MTVTPADYQMRPDDRENPLLWITRVDLTGRTLPNTSDAALTTLGVPPGRGRLVRSWGHNSEGVHWLLTRAGTPPHTDRAYLRYTHQIVLRNDGTRIRGLARHDPTDRSLWPPVLTPGAYYCLDTHSPHQGTTDPRLPQRPGRTKIVIAVDRDQPLTDQEAWLLLHPYLDRQLTDDPMTTRPPRYRKTGG
jgi:hypothetical protein